MSKVYYEYHYIDANGEEKIYNSFEPNLSQITIGDSVPEYCHCCGGYLGASPIVHDISYCIIKPRAEFPTPDDGELGEADYWDGDCFQLGD